MRETLEKVAEAARPYVGRGDMAGYIPRLAEVDPDQFGMAVASADGSVDVHR